jgi:hypothetical protein
VREALNFMIRRAANYKEDQTNTFAKRGETTF